MAERTGGVGDLAGGVGQQAHQTSIGIGDRHEQERADCEAERRANRAAARQPIVHHDQPAGADHRTEGKREVVDAAEFAR